MAELSPGDEILNPGDLQTKHDEGNLEEELKAISPDSPPEGLQQQLSKQFSSVKQVKQGEQLMQPEEEKMLRESVVSSSSSEWQPDPNFNIGMVNSNMLQNDNKFDAKKK